MRMPTYLYSTMEFSRFLELVDLGYASAKTMLADFAKDGKLPTGMESDVSMEVIQKRGQSMRRNSI